ncbi:MAG TPA: Uma2 family endonuclease [Pyrinomonadaceae bacterium]|nr:Uma2 family endonuclease [Pyrinomonadaceae bacterium]
MNISVNQILEMPNAAILAERLQTALQAEQANRRHFYEIIEEDKKMEFINGEIIFQSPAKLRHTKSIKLLTKLLDTFVEKHDLGFVGSEKMLISLTRNDYEPDICFFESSKSNNFRPEQMQFPAPDFVVEVLSPSTEKFDREIKFQDYAAHGIREYWIIEPKNEFIEQYFLQAEEYELLLKAKDGTIESVVLPNFRIQIRAVFDEKLNLEELKRII